MSKMSVKRKNRKMSVASSHHTEHHTLNKFRTLLIILI